MEIEKPKSITGYIISIVTVYFICWLSVISLRFMCDCNWNEYAPTIFFNISFSFALASSLIVFYLNKKRRMSILSLVLILGIGVMAYGFIKTTMQESDFMQESTPGGF